MDTTFIDENYNVLEHGYPTNKDVKFKKINSIYIKNFRTMKDQTLTLGSSITLISGKNGTMKSSLLGLLAHPFSSPNKATDIFGNELKTNMRNVFRLSLDKDNHRYEYYLNAISCKNTPISEKIRIYISKKDNRHRVTVGIDNKGGRGNFNLNTAYINLKRLFPIIDTSAAAKEIAELSLEDKNFISRAYMRIFTRNSFNEFEYISDSKDKNTLAPKNFCYDFNSISSGEDNLGNILIKMLAFQKFKTNENNLQGIFCIDEIEASLHPIALTNFFDFLLEWSQNHSIQVVATTHSLHLIDHALKYHSRHSTYKDKININIISTAMVSGNNYRIINNPPYSDAYKELTLKLPEEIYSYKVNILCEDDMAMGLLKKIFGAKLNKLVDFIPNISGGTGTPYQSLVALGKNGPKLLDDSIIILDPDITDNIIVPVRNKNVSIFILPCIFNNHLTIEQSVILYAMNLEDNHQIFLAFGEKIAFLNSLHTYNIYENEIPTTDCCKNWVTNNRSKFARLLTVFASENKEKFSHFLDIIICEINKKRSEKSLPQIFQ